jgi:hypothetical protein
VLLQPFKGAGSAFRHASAMPLRSLASGSTRKPHHYSAGRCTNGLSSIGGPKTQVPASDGRSVQGAGAGRPDRDRHDVYGPQGRGAGTYHPAAPLADRDRRLRTAEAAKLTRGPVCVGLVPTAPLPRRSRHAARLRSSRDRSCRERRRG